MTYVTTAPTFVPGEVVTATKMNALADGIQAAWTAYTPTWTCLTGSNPSLGNGTLTGRYIQIGKTVTFHLDLFTGSTTTFGTGRWAFSLPVSLYSGAGSGPPLCNALCVDSSASTAYVGTTSAGGAASLVVYTSAAAPGVDATHPFTWAVSDQLGIAGTYETT